QLHWNVELAKLFDRFGQHELPAIDVEPLLRERLGDVGGGDRSVQHVGLADLARDRDLDAANTLGHHLRDLLFLGFLGVELLALPLDLLFVAGGDEQRQLPRQEVVAGVTVRHLHHFTPAPDVINVLSENDFHKVVLFSWNAEAAGPAEKIIPASAARSAFNLVGHIRNQGNLTRALDRRLQFALVHRAGAGDASRQNLAPFRHERSDQLHVLVVDVIDLVRAELADLPAAEQRAP